MAAPFPPSTIRAWQYTRVKGGIENNLRINSAAALPKPKPDQHLVQVIATALNPVDYKPAEIPIAGRLVVSNPATPGIDFAGRIVKAATGSPLRRGQLVFGAAGTTPFAAGALSEFAISGKDATVALPDGVDAIDAATIAVAGLTAYQSIVPNVKKGDRIFINGGSGGTGSFGIQIAKAVGCHVTTTCSTPNVALCQSLGADEVVDYKKSNVVAALKASGTKFDHVVDNVGTDFDLYWHCHEFTKPEAVYVMVGGVPSWSGVADRLKITFYPSFLGGGKRKYSGFWPKPNPADLERIALWIKDGTLKAVIDHRFAFDQAPEAFRRLKTGRARGKIVIDVVPEADGKAWAG